jgi:hypothetical protein
VSYELTHELLLRHLSLYPICPSSPPAAAAAALPHGLWSAAAAGCRLPPESDLSQRRLFRFLMVVLVRAGISGSALKF